MVLVVTSVATKEVLERWTFDIQTDREVLDGGCAVQAGGCAACACSAHSTHLPGRHCCVTWLVAVAGSRRL